MLKNPAKFFKILGVFLLLLSALLTYQHYTPQRLAFAGSIITENTTSINSSQTPTQIKIDKLNINLPIIPASFKNKKFQTTDKGVSYLTSSPLPGQVGNSILYGHNWTNILGNLPKIKPGDNIRIYYTDNSFKDFTVNFTIEVTPENTSVLQNSSDTRITIYTCSGFLDRKDS